MTSIHEKKRSIGDAGELIARQALIDAGWVILEENFTIRGGEIDFMVENDEYICCVEVRTVNIVDDLMAYMTKKKISALKKTFDTYLRKFPNEKQPRIDVIFIKDSKVWEWYENVTGN